MGVDRIGPRRSGHGGFTQQETRGLRRPPSRPEGPGACCPRSGSARREPRARPPLLVDRTGHPREAGPARVGGEGDRPARHRPPEGVPRQQGVLRPQPQVHEELRAGLAGPGSCATGRCTNPVGPQRPPPREGRRAREAALVRPEDGRERLEPERTRDPHRARALARLRAEPARTSRPRSRLHSQTSRGRRSRTPTSSTSSASPKTPKSA